MVSGRREGAEGRAEGRGDRPTDRRKDRAKEGDRQTDHRAGKEYPAVGAGPGCPRGRIGTRPGPEENGRDSATPGWRAGPWRARPEAKERARLRVCARRATHAAR